MERATIVADGDFVTFEHLPPHSWAGATLPAPGPSSTSSRAVGDLTPGTTVEEAETRLIELTLAHTRNNKTRAAEILGISLKTLHNKLNRLKAIGTPTEPR